MPSSKLRLGSVVIACILSTVLANTQSTIKLKATEAIKQSLQHHFSELSPADWAFKAAVPQALFHCDQPYRVQWRQSPQPGANTAKLNCPGTNKQAYISIEISQFVDVLVAAQPLARGDTITFNDATAKRMDISELRLGYFHDRKEIAGWTVQRTIKAGQVLTPYIVKAPVVVKRGDWVQILSGSAGLEVTMMGEAQKNGMIGEQIPVKNLHTDKRIKAWVLRKGVVSTRRNDN